MNDSSAAHVRRIFDAARFVSDLGIELREMGDGWCETSLSVAPRHLQQHGYVHAGVEATMADHTAGGAAATLLPKGRTVLTIEFKINFLRPAKGPILSSRAVVLKGGKNISVAESEVFDVDGEEKTLVAKATVTLAIVNEREEQNNR